MIPATPRFHRSFTAQTNAWFLKDSGDKALLPGIIILYVGESGGGATAIPHFKNSKYLIHAMERVPSAVRTPYCPISMQAKCSVGIVTILQLAQAPVMQYDSFL
jgi:hypothetical protein